MVEAGRFGEPPLALFFSIKGGITWWSVDCSFSGMQDLTTPSFSSSPSLIFHPPLLCYMSASHTHTQTQVNLLMYVLALTLLYNSLLTSVLHVIWSNICMRLNKVADDVWRRLFLCFMGVGVTCSESWTCDSLPTPPQRPSQNGADKAAPFNLSQMCSLAPVCSDNC